MEKECDSKRIESVRVYRPKWTSSSASAGTSSEERGDKKGGGRGWLGGGGGGVGPKSRRPPVQWYTLGFLVLYALQVGWVLSTVGEPYRVFLEKADREGFQGACAAPSRVVSCRVASLP
jgi:hypothetical protein